MTGNEFANRLPLPLITASIALTTAAAAAYALSGRGKCSDRPGNLLLLAAVFCLVLGAGIAGSAS